MPSCFIGREPFRLVPAVAVWVVIALLAGSVPLLGQTPVSVDCVTGDAVTDPADNPGLVADCETLLALRDTLAGTAVLNWSAATPIESWTGISLDGTPPRVAWLVLQNLSLNGSIPVQLANLPSLVLILLDRNQLTGSIPPQLGNLSNLSALRIERNQLTGSIPAELGNLSNLAHLGLSSNDLTGSIPSQLGDLSKLTLLHLDRNELTGSIPSQLGSLSSLDQLNLRGNELTGPISSQLGNLSDLTVLDLAGNRLAGSIPSQLGNLAKLSRLSLGGNRLTGSIPSELANLVRLTELNLGGNAFTGCIPAGLLSVGSHDLASLDLLYCETLLSDLNVTPGTLTPQFDSDVTDYTATVTGTQFTVGAVKDPSATLLYLDRDNTELSDADTVSDGHQVDLSGGATLVRVKVVSQGGLAARLYTMQVNQPESPRIITPVIRGVNSLTIPWSAPVVTGGAAVTSYDLRYIKSADYFTADRNWTVVEGIWTAGPLSHELTGLIPDTWYYFQVRSFNGAEGPWSNSVTTSTLAELSSVTTLSGLSISPGTLTPAFESDVTDYTASGDANEATVNPVSDHDATFEFLDVNNAALLDANRGLDGYQIDLTGGARLVRIKVISQDGSAQRFYSVEVSPSGVQVNPPGPPSITTPVDTGPYTLTVDWDAPVQTGSAAITSYDLRYIETVADESVDSNWTLVKGVWTTGYRGYQLTGIAAGTEYDIQIRAFNGAEGPWSSTATGTTEAATENTPPSFLQSDPFPLTVAENTRQGMSIGGAVAATDVENDPLIYTLGGVDASSFDVVEASGQLRTKAVLDYETKSSYAVILLVRDGKDSLGAPDTVTDDTINVTVSVTNVDEPGYLALSSTQPRFDTPLTAELTDPDLELKNLVWSWERSSDRMSTWESIPGATSSSYEPMEDDVDNHLRVTVLYDDGHGSGKSVTTPLVNPVGGREEPPPASEVFDDVTMGIWYESAVTWMIHYRITAGCTVTRFCPERNLTRQEFVTFLWRAADRPTPRYPGSEAFSDVKQGIYADQAIGWAASNGVTAGCTQGEFGDPSWQFCPEQHVTRDRWQLCYIDMWKPTMWDPSLRTRM